MSWEELDRHVAETGLLQVDKVNGPTNAQSRLRLFGHSEDSVRVTLFRDNHAWCPYCQKVWLWLEEKKLPYKVEKVTMFCYGEKEAWYKRKVPSGMLPALELDGQIITESDVILYELERAFGPLYKGMEDPAVIPLRKLERLLFRAWCGWLCQPNWFPGEEKKARKKFEDIMEIVEGALSQTPGGYFLEEFSTADCVFLPYVERMAASLFYYKGYVLRDYDKNPKMSAWFDAMETRETYRGTQSDYHTHAHDLPPQMGGCYENGEDAQKRSRQMVDEGPWDGTVPDAMFGEPDNAADEAVARTYKHRENIVKANPVEDEVADEAIRCALTYLKSGELVAPPKGGDVALRYLRDRVNVPRDMSIYAARRMRTALERTAALAGDGEGPPIPVNHRRDQDPRAFR